MEVDAEQPAALPPLCIEGFGFDTGWVNAGAAGGRFLGWLDMVDEETGETRREVKLEVMALENWDLTTAVITRMGAKAKSCVRVAMRETRAKSDHMQDWIEAMALMIAQSDWIFATHRSMLDAGEARLPFLIVENQFDHIKSDYVKTQNREICNITAATVLGHDFRAARASAAPTHRPGAHSFRPASTAAAWASMDNAATAAGSAWAAKSRRWRTRRICWPRNRARMARCGSTICSTWSRWASRSTTSATRSCCWCRR